MPRRDYSKVAFAATGDTNVIPGSVQPDGSVSLPQGWGFDYQRDNGAGGGTPDPLAKNIDREDMNGILNEITASIGEIQQNGFPIWISTAAPYPINAYVRDSDRIWKSQVTNNSSTPGSNSDWIDVTSVAPVFILADASAGSTTLTLPPANASTGPAEIIYRRTDITSNAVVIQVSGTDKIMLDTSASTSGSTQTELVFGGDYLRLRSDAAGKWWCVGQAPLPASIASGVAYFTATGPSNYIVPPVLRSGRRKATVTVTGAGGSGGLTNNSPQRGAGGGAGGTAIKLIDLTGVSTVSYAVGAGVNPGAGGTSTFGAYCSATGGGIGADTAGGGAGGVGSGGDVNIYGGYGTDSGTAGAGGGGASYWGGGVRGGDGGGSSGLIAALGSGAGGSVTARSAGAPGVIKVEW